MRVYLISYDLRGYDEDYDVLIGHLRELGAIRVLDSTWILASERRAKALRDELYGLMDPNHGLLVVRLQRGSAWINLDVPDAEVLAVVRQAT